MSDDELQQSGTKMHSGRYPWGSGEEAYQHEQFIGKYESLKAKGMAPTDIAKEMGMNTTQLRNNITWARDKQKAYLTENIGRDLAAGGMTKTAIAKKYNISEGTVRNFATPKQKHNDNQFESVNKALAEAIEKNQYLDVGVGVELQIGVARNKFNSVVNKMVTEDGYYIHEIFVPRLNDPLKPTTLKVLSKEPDYIVVRNNSDKIRPLDSWSDDRGETISNLADPIAVNPDRVKVRYKEEGGNGKDGIIELRPGVEDLDMGSSHYAQVRIKVGEDRFLKGMAVMGDAKDFPDGVDLIFNTNKPLGTDKRDVLKKTKEDSDNIFGSSIKPQFQNKSRVINVVNEEGDWDTWSKSLSSQFLAKQPRTLIKERLDATHKKLQMDFDEIVALNNPIVKQYLMNKFADGLESKAAKLGAQGLVGTKSHVILPFPNMNPNEIYAPNYRDGERVVLIRYPHGGVFEIPEVTVNNKNPEARKTLGMALDAIGIHPSVAEKLSGADFDGDTVYVIPNNTRGPLAIKTSRSLKELKNFDPMDYKLPKSTKVMTKKEQQEDTARREAVKQIEMGKASNLITDMTIKGASQAEIARAVKHSMVVIDSAKHNLDFRKSAIDNNISALKKDYQSNINPDTNKKTIGASTLLSRAKRKVNIADPDFDPDKYSSGTEVESLYSGYIKKLKGLRTDAVTKSNAIKPPKYDSDAAKVYKTEIESLNKKLVVAKLNAPRERQAQLLTNKLYWSNLTPEMEKEQKKKLRSRSLARARDTVGAKGRDARIDLTDKEWQAIQARAVSPTKLKEVLRYSDMDQIKQLATPRVVKYTSAKAQRAASMLDNGLTYAEVSQALGVSTTTVRDMIDG